MSNFLSVGSFYENTIKSIIKKITYSLFKFELASFLCYRVQDRQEQSCQHTAS